MNFKKQIVLIILDGWGHRTEKEYNAIIEADTPFFDRLWQTYPHTLLEASGLAVGLPEGQMGTSEVGHTTIGLGRTIDTDLVRINKSAANGEFKNNPTFHGLFNHVKKYDSTLHVQGLIGPGGVHSSQEHLFAFIKAAKEAEINKIAIHAFTDGRDTAPQSSAGFLEELEKFLSEIGIGFIASTSGRYYAMDRDNNWDRLDLAYQAMFCGQAKKTCQTRQPSTVLKELYLNNIIDEQLEPIVFLDEKGCSWPVGKNDGIFFFNFRSDRAKMLAKKIMEDAEKNNWYFATMTEYSKDIKSNIAFPSLKIETTLAEQISLAGLSQAHIAETEKFAHATLFLNGGRETPYENEVDILIESRKDIKTHDLAPKMKAKEIADEAIKQIKNGTNFIFINFANADMVGHTANREALIQAVEEVDFQFDRVIDEAIKNNAAAIVTADHGNAEVYYDIVTDSKHTAHTTSLVPFILTEEKIELSDHGSLADIAPTILEILEIKKPEFMTGKSLIKK